VGVGGSCSAAVCHGRRPVGVSAAGRSGTVGVTANAHPASAEMGLAVVVPEAAPVAVMSQDQLARGHQASLAGARGPCLCAGAHVGNRPVWGPLFASFTCEGSRLRVAEVLFLCRLSARNHC
jgi:hypothetical protein